MRNSQLPGAPGTRPIEKTHQMTRVNRVRSLSNPGRQSQEPRDIRQTVAAGEQGRCRRGANSGRLGGVAHRTDKG